MSSGKVLLGVLAGVTTGVLLGVLFAPEKGSKTRKKIAGKGEDFADALTEKFNEFLESITEKFKRAKEDFDSEKGKIISRGTVKDSKTAGGE